MRKVLPVAAIAALALFTGCERAVPHNDYFPMRDGNVWEYRMFDQKLLQELEAGRQVGTAPNISGDVVEPEEKPRQPKAEVVGAEGQPAKAKASREARRISLQLKESIDEITFRASYDNYEQVWSKRSGYIGFQDAKKRHYLLILPPHTGYKWIADQGDGQNLYYEIEGQQDLSTPAGMFYHCAVAREESRDKTEVNRYWFAPGVGLVRRSKYFQDEEVMRQELVKYNVRPSSASSRLEEEKELEKAMGSKKHGQEFRSEDDKAKVLPLDEDPGIKNK